MNAVVVNGSLKTLKDEADFSAQGISVDRIVKPDGYDARVTLQMHCVVHGDEGLST